MFGKRADGVKVKDLQIIEKAMGYFMPMRIDAVNLFEQTVNCEILDQFILEQKKATGIHYTLTEILIAACVRMLYLRPKTNYFISNCVVYKRKYISISISIKPRLKDDCDEITLKMFFKGTESLPEIKKMIDDEIARNIKADADTHKTTKTAGFLGKLPSWMFKAAVGLLRFGDNHGMLPRWLLDVSPFHTSAYVTDLRSIKLDAIYHHLYNFGNTTIFGAMGKAFYAPVANRDGEVSVQKQFKLKFSLDERVCDGLYYGNSLKLLMSFIENPAQMLEPLPQPQLTGKELKIWQKEEKLAAKRIEKIEKADQKAKIKAEKAAKKAEKTKKSN